MTPLQRNNVINYQVRRSVGSYPIKNIFPYLICINKNVSHYIRGVEKYETEAI